MKLGRLYIGRDKYYSYNHYWLWIICWWPHLWIGWEITEDEDLDRKINQILSDE